MAPVSSAPNLQLRSGAVEWRPVDDGVVVLDLHRSEYLHVNPSGAGLWRLLSEGTTKPEMVRHLAETYGLDEAQAAADVEAFVADLAAKRLLHRP